MPELHNPPNERPIPELFAFVSIDENGNEGIVASILPGLGATPMVTASLKALEGLKGMAEELARQSGKAIVLRRFARAA